MGNNISHFDRCSGVVGNNTFYFLKSPLHATLPSMAATPPEQTDDNPAPAANTIYNAEAMREQTRDSCEVKTDLTGILFTKEDLPQVVAAVSQGLDKLESITQRLCTLEERVGKLDLLCSLLYEQQVLLRENERLRRTQSWAANLDLVYTVKVFYESVCAAVCCLRRPEKEEPTERKNQ